MSLSLQKANFWKRISAYLFDSVLTMVLSVGFLIVLLTFLGYDGYAADYAKGQQVYYTQYEEQYGVDFDISEEDLEKLSEEDKAVYDKAFQEAQAAIKADAELAAIYRKMFSLILVSVAISLLLSIFVLHFILPLFFKNGQTLGKKIFGIAVMRANHVKISAPVLFIRSIVGLYVMETMAVILLCLMGIVGIIAAVLVLGLQIFVMIKTQTNSSIHDLLSDTVVVDFASQRIFDTQEDMVAFKLEQEAAESERLADETPTNV